MISCAGCSTVHNIMTGIRHHGIVVKSSGIQFMKDNFFNTNIIQNHDLNMWLNNSMAETYDFCLSVAVALENETDQAWYYQQKRGYLCYDV